MSTVLKDLEPKKVFHYFEEICNIPHVSYHMEAICKYIEDFALLNHLNYVRDEAGNIVIYKKASTGYETHDGVILQGHLDMVGAKTPDCTLDLIQEPILLDEEGISEGMVRAKQTTLGGDDGIAVAYMLAILSDPELKHPRLECVFTVNEEVGLLGASCMDMSVLTGKTLINIDSEEEGVFITGSAGGVHLDCMLPMQEGVADYTQYRLKISNLTGGHSGTYIGTGRPSAVMLLGRVLFHMSEEVDFCLGRMMAGEVDNAIAPEAEAILCLESSDSDMLATLKLICSRQQADIRNEYQGIDDQVLVSFEPVSEAEKVSVACSRTSSQKAIFYLYQLPYGVISRNSEDLNLVETSLNPGVLRMDSKEMKLGFLIRSSVDSARDEISLRLIRFTQMMGGDFNVEGEYPGWAYNPNSNIREKITEIYTSMYGEKPRFETIHAGLECGIFYNQIPGLDVVSYGPDLFDIHTPNEKLMIESTRRVYEMTLRLLEEL